MMQVTLVALSLVYQHRCCWFPALFFQEAMSVIKNVLSTLCMIRSWDVYLNKKSHCTSDSKVVYQVGGILLWHIVWVVAVVVPFLFVTNIQNTSGVIWTANDRKLSVVKVTYSWFWRLLWVSINSSYDSQVLCVTSIGQDHACDWSVCWCYSCFSQSLFNFYRWCHKRSTRTDTILSLTHTFLGSVVLLCQLR